MGFGLMFWSLLTFSLPMQQQNATVNLQKQLLASHTIVGIASYYHDRFVGRPTSTGAIFSNDKFTAASNYFKLNTYVKVTNLRNGHYIYVKVNDRMGEPGRVIDLTHRAADSLGFVYQGLTKVRIEQVPEPIGENQIIAQREGPDDSQQDNTL